MRVVFASAWLAFLSTVFLTAFVSPEPVSAFVTTNPARNTFRELKDTAQDGMNDVVIDPGLRLDDSETLSQFWKDALSLGQRGQDYADSLIYDVAHKADPTTAVRLHGIQNTLQAIIHGTEDLKALIVTQVHDESFDDFQRGIENILANILEELKDRFPPPYHAPNHAEREGNVTLVVNITEEALIKFGVEHGMSEEEFRVRLDPIMKNVEEVIVAIGDLAEQHPYLLETLLVSGVMLIIPESWFLRPLLRLFGMSPKVPSKRTFFGGTIPKGSWFSYLQRAAMGHWARKSIKKTILGSILGGIGLIGAIFASCGCV
ncbi:uncharacterized protein B0H18DRAFT_956494 [Fomitopsis serialis]|uniref:uncharacterized protein n=1 Tax=Fomitopsis serialis TaxID=139415 RepID=UPI002008DA66|nr:uncharacterized protein B0H18DRAFT_956494 [Neoantrodia serialis]KAH9921755.1 hypothetical protein B0H18DRAFT_956494 [Neoantrodia serialis]